MRVPNPVLSLAATLLATSLTGQEVTRLETPTATFPEPFSNVTGLVELSDGRVMLADRLEQAVRILDMRAGTFESIGRVGGGPGEYQMPGGLLPLPGDSALLIDFGNMRLSIIAPDGSIPRSTNMMTDDGVFIRPTGADGTGAVYFDMGGLRINNSGSATTSPKTPIARLDMATGDLDTAAFLPPIKIPTRTRSISTSGGSFAMSGGFQPFAKRAAHRLPAGHDHRP